MNRYIHICLLSIVFMAFSCEQIPSTDKSLKITFDLENDKLIRMWCNSSHTFEVLEDGLYTCSSSNEHIATITFRDGEFKINTHSPGIAIISITNEFGLTNEIKCISECFSNYWREDDELKYIYKNSIMAVLGDESYRHLIEAELNQYSVQRGYEYYFAPDSDELIVHGENDIHGTYSFNWETNTLILNYNNIRERYYVDIQPYDIHISYPPMKPEHSHFIVALQQDLTQYIDTKYPKANVQNAYVIRHIIALGSWWIL